MSQTVHTYHCLCTQLLLASTTPLPSLPQRTRDKASVCVLTPSSAEYTPAPGSHYASLLNSTMESKPSIIRREDGFEKRYIRNCARCKCAVGYQLDKSQFEEMKGESGRREDVVYLLPGGLQSTEDMKMGKSMEKGVELVASEV